MYKVILGIAIGVILFLLVCVGYQNFILSTKQVTVVKVHTTKSDTTKVDNIGELTVGIAEINQRLESYNKRIDDFWVFLGIIITLLLAINVGVFVNAEREVEKYLDKHFEGHKAQILKHKEEAESMVAQISTINDLAQRMKANISQQPIQETNDRGN